MLPFDRKNFEPQPFSRLTGFVINPKLRRFKGALKTWNVNFKNNLKRQKEAILEEIKKLEENSDSSNIDLSLRITLRVDLHAIYRTEERNLIQKIKLNWLKLGDENTNFFHRFLDAKKRKNLISKLINEQGSSTSSFREIEDIILDFYSSLYSKSISTGSILLNFARSYVSSIQNTKLSSRFGLDEIKQAMKYLGRNKATNTK